MARRWSVRSLRSPNILLRISTYRRCWPRRADALPKRLRRLPDRHNRAHSQAGRELAHLFSRNGDAAGGRREAGPGEVEEDGAAASLGAAVESLVEDEDEVVKMVVAPHAVGAIAGRQPHRPVIARAL